MIRRRAWRMLLLCLLIVLFMYTVIYVIVPGNPVGTSNYNSYTLQALSWREGRLCLAHDYPHLELAIYQNEYYVSFPPVPTIPVWLLSFFFGVSTPDDALVKLYTLFALICAAFSLPAVGSLTRALPRALCAACILLLSPLLSISIDGGVWYQAQTLSLALTLGAVMCVRHGRWTPACLMYALAVGCRPFQILYAIPFMAIAFSQFRQSGTLARPCKMARALLPGIACGVMVAGLLMAYNDLRFGDILEFGHNYLPEFQRSATGQFSVVHIIGNARTFLWGLPFTRDASGALSAQMFGFSIFISCPALLFLPLLAVRDVIKRGMTWRKCFILIACAVHITLLLSHRTMGGYQFGSRYMIDTLPYVILYLGEAPFGFTPKWQYLIPALPLLALSVYGACIL